MPVHDRPRVQRRRLRVSRHRPGRGLPAVRLPAGARARARRLGEERWRRRHHRDSGCDGSRRAHGPALARRRTGVGARRSRRCPCLRCRSVARRLRDPGERRRPHGDGDRTRRRRVRAVPRGTFHADRPALSLRVRQLHALRAALHDHPRAALRPHADEHGGLRAVPALSRRIPGAGRPPLSCRAERLSRLRTRADAVGRRRRAGSGHRSHRRHARAPRTRRDRRHQGIGRLPPRLRRAQRRCGGAPARAQVARGKSRSR